LFGGKTARLNEHKSNFNRLTFAVLNSFFRQKNCRCFGISLHFKGLLAEELKKTFFQLKKAGKFEKLGCRRDEAKSTCLQCTT
jgi:hypothetical protein